MWEKNIMDHIRNGNFHALLNVDVARLHGSLHAACDHGHSGIAKLLIDRGAGVNEVNDDGDTPICVATFRGHYYIVDTLIDHGAHMDVAVQFAAAYGQPRVMGLLIRRGAHIDPINLHRACMYGNYDTVRVLLDSGMDVDAPMEETAYAPLHMVMLRGVEDTNHSQNNLKVMNVLIEHGAKVDARNAWGATPLHLACERGHIISAMTLLQSGADVGATDEHGRTPWDCALEYGQHHVANVL